MELNTRELQLELLKIIKDFHKICSDNGFAYFMLGGTCLGAVRHKGFIPWDDDMDVGMPREDYNRFCNMANELLPENLELRYYQTSEDSPFHYAKLINRDTTLVEKKYHDYIEGIYIDLFPLDNMTKYSLANKIRFKRILFTHACIMNHCSTEKKSGTIKKMFMAYSKRRNLMKLHRSLEKLMLKENDKTGAFLCNFLGSWKEREFTPVEVFGSPTLYSFEDTSLCGPADADAYLTALYGDYMKLPPIEKQVCRHDYYYVNLGLPYKDYKKN